MSQVQESSILLPYKRISERIFPKTFYNTQYRSKFNRASTFSLSISMLSWESFEEVWYTNSRRDNCSWFYKSCMILESV